MLLVYFGGEYIINFFKFNFGWTVPLSTHFWDPVFFWDFLKSCLYPLQLFMTNILCSFPLCVSGSGRTLVWKTLRTFWPSWVWSGMWSTPTWCVLSATPSPRAPPISAPLPWQPSPTVSMSTVGWTIWRPQWPWTGRSTENTPSKTENEGNLNFNSWMINCKCS